MNEVVGLAGSLVDTLGDAFAGLEDELAQLAEGPRAALLALVDATAILRARRDELATAWQRMKDEVIGKPFAVASSAPSMAIGRSVFEAVVTLQGALGKVLAALNALLDALPADGPDGGERARLLRRLKLVDPKMGAWLGRG